MILDKSEGVQVNVAFFDKTEISIIVDACQISLSQGQNKLLPTQLTIIFENIKQTILCASNLQSLEVPGRANDIYNIELYYPEIIYPEDDISVTLPPLNFAGDAIHLQPFRFKKGSHVFCTIVL
ncbi:MAG: hypothetical protein KKA70_10020 [Proteobacteria bacterium]|nr:hypothetical protein [Pseudomonadota bacterium]